MAVRTVTPGVTIREHDYAYTKSAEEVPDPFMITIEFWDQDPNKIRVEIEPDKVTLTWWKIYAGIPGVTGNRYGNLRGDQLNYYADEYRGSKELCSLIVDDLSVLETFINHSAVPVDSVEEPFGKVIPDGPLRDYVDRLNNAKQHKDIIDL